MAVFYFEYKPPPFIALHTKQPTRTSQISRQRGYMYNDGPTEDDQTPRNDRESVNLTTSLWRCLAEQPRECIKSGDSGVQM